MLPKFSTTHQYWWSFGRMLWYFLEKFRKRGGVQKSMGNKVPWKTGTLIYLLVTSRPLISLQKEAVLSSCNFATAHLTACILIFHLPWTSRPVKRRTLSQRPKNYYQYCFLPVLRLDASAPAVVKNHFPTQFLHCPLTQNILPTSSSFS